MPIRSRPTLLLDLDGTLVDPAPGILGCCRYALAKLGIPPEETGDLGWVIGPPIRDSFRRLLNGRAEIEEAVRIYRERYSESGLYEASAYPGVREALAARRAQGARLVLCTSKFHGFAKRVVEHFGFSPLLSAVYGAELDGRLENKADLIAEILVAEGLQAEEVCMIGDRKHDVLGAAAHGIPTVGVLWGYGGRDELQSAGAAILVDRPDELLAEQN